MLIAKQLTISFIVAAAAELGWWLLGRRWAICDNRCNDKCQNKAAAWLYYGGYVLLVAMGRISGVYLHLTSTVPGLNMVSKLYEYLYIEAELRKPTYAENFFLYMFTWFMFFVDTVLIAVVMMTIYLRCGRYIPAVQKRLVNFSGL